MHLCWLIRVYSVPQARKRKACRPTSQRPAANTRDRRYRYRRTNAAWDHSACSRSSGWCRRDPAGSLKSPRCSGPWSSTGCEVEFWVFRRRCRRRARGFGSAKSEWSKHRPRPAIPGYRGSQERRRSLQRLPWLTTEVVLARLRKVKPEPRERAMSNASSPPVKQILNECSASNADDLNVRLSKGFNHFVGNRRVGHQHVEIVGRTDLPTRNDPELAVIDHRNFLLRMLDHHRIELSFFRIVATHASFAIDSVGANEQDVNHDSG